MWWHVVIEQQCGFCLCPQVWSERHWSWFPFWESMKWCSWCWQTNAWRAGVAMLGTLSIWRSAHFRFVIQWHTFLFVLNVIHLNPNVQLFRGSWLLCCIVLLMARYAFSFISVIITQLKVFTVWNSATEFYNQGFTCPVQSLRARVTVRFSVLPESGPQRLDKTEHVHSFIELDVNVYLMTRVFQMKCRSRLS